MHSSCSEKNCILHIAHSVNMKETIEIRKRIGGDYQSLLAGLRDHESSRTENFESSCPGEDPMRQQQKTEDALSSKTSNEREGRRVPVANKKSPTSKFNKRAISCGSSMFASLFTSSPRSSSSHCNISIVNYIWFEHTRAVVF